MRQPTSILQAALLAALLTCHPASQATPPVISVPSAGLPQTGTPLNYLRLASGSYKYQFTQTTNVQSQDPIDTVLGVVRTRALLLVVVSPQPDSTFSVVVSIDSIAIEREGSIPLPSAPPVPRLDSALHTVFTPTGNITRVFLPDSLCAYSQLVIAARDLLLPKLSNDLEVPLNRVHRDTTRFRGCRAGIAIELLTYHQLRDLNADKLEFSFEQQTDIRGAGMLRRDSLTVAGAVLTLGKVVFQQGNRLPSRVESRSEGTITVRLGTGQTVFHQTSAQEVQLDRS